MRKIKYNKIERKEIEAQDKLKLLCDFAVQVKTEIFDEMSLEGSGEHENYLDPVIDRIMMISILANDVLKSTIEYGLAENKAYNHMAFRGLDIGPNKSNIDWIDNPIKP